MKVTEWAARGGNDLMGGAQLSKKPGQKKTAEEILGMPHVTLKDVEDIIIAVQRQAKTRSDALGEGEEDETATILMTPSSSAVYDTVEASVKYQCYVRRQHKDMESWRRAQGLRIPPDVLYDRINLPTLSIEELEKLNAVRPTSFAEAAQISGITPQSLVYLYHNIMRRNKRRDGRSSENAAVRRNEQQANQM
jgi:tRNA uridine 5-carboxymethylaminomethyl modification enzyme